MAVFYLRMSNGYPSVKHSRSAKDNVFNICLVCPAYPLQTLEPHQFNIPRAISKCCGQTLFISLPFKLKLGNSAFELNESLRGIYILNCVDFGTVDILIGKK